MIKLDTRYSKIPFETIQLVRKFKINKKSRKLDLEHKPTNQTRCNTKNLVKIDITSNDRLITNNLRIATVNTRSIKNKVELVLENSELDNIDILAITETWLNNTDEDQVWVETSGLQDQSFTFHSHNRIGRRGGGLGLWHRSEYQSKRIEYDPIYTTLEQAGWELRIKDRIITVLVIYHPPGNTPTRLLDEVSELVQYYLTNHKNLVILGDFNVAVQDLNNLDSLAFYDTMEALGLKQHIDKPTHQLGNTLDHIYTESLDQLGVQHAFIGPFILDHRIVGIEVSQDKGREQLDMQPRRPVESFKEEFNNETILQHSKLDQIWEAFNNEVRRTLDKLVPECKPKKKAKPARLWYNSRLLEQKRIVSNRENKYIKYRQDHHWKAFTREIDTLQC